MADTQKKRTTVPSSKPKKTTTRRTRSKTPVSQYTDVGQRRPAPRPKPEPLTDAATPKEDLVPTVAALQQPVAAEPAAEPVTATTAAITQNSIPVARRLGLARRSRLLLAGLLVLVTATGLVIWRHTPKSESVGTLVRQVGQVTVLPANETPIVSTVVDKPHVTQTFLASAQNGDKVLLYYQAKKAIVYRPSTRQVITIGPIAEGPARVFVRNGGVSTQTLQQVQTTIADDLAAFSVSSTDTSPDPHYQATEVVDLTGVRPDVASKLARLIHAKVVSLPAGENRPDGDMLVIVGKDSY